jgi:hypothetical protein
MEMIILIGFGYVAWICTQINNRLADTNELLRQIRDNKDPSES